MAGPLDFAGMVPGFDFLQGLMKGAGNALPPMGQWVAPTLDPEELDKRIQELRTVQFWLEQNAKLLGTTIQALEVQRMTLATLKTMNMPMTDLRDALSIKVPRPAAPAPAAPAAPSPVAPAAEAPPQAGAAPAAPAVDPVKWWGALTEQFTEIASQAMKAAPVLAAGMPAADAPVAAARKSSASRARAAPAARKAAPAAKRSRSAAR
jgi:hypothetical protein